MTRWVKQEDGRGCVLAALAMLTGQTYAQVKSEFFDQDWNNNGCTFEFDAHTYLAEHGYAIATKYRYYHPQKRDREIWPVPPFAPAHLCSVIVANGSHAVVLLADGTVLDPSTPKQKKLSDYSAVNSVMGVWKI
jgi:hypothetical protein